MAEPLLDRFVFHCVFASQLLIVLFLFFVIVLRMSIYFNFLKFLIQPEPKL